MKGLQIISPSTSGKEKTTMLNISTMITRTIMWVKVTTVSDRLTLA